RDGRLSSRRGPAYFAKAPAALEEDVARFRGSIKLWALFRDPPDHTRLRALASKAFAPGLVEGMRPRLRAVVDDLLLVPVAAGRLEVVRELAYPLPAIVIAEMLGAPAEDRDHFKRWADDLADFLA